MADYNRADEIARLQKELTDYKSPVLSSQIRCAVFGHTGVGKSSFINSIFYALTNKWDAPAKGGSRGKASMTLRWEPINVAGNIVVYNNRGTANVIADYLREAKRQKRYTPMFVITHHFVAGDQPLAREFKSVLGALRIDEDDIFCVENYTRDRHSLDDEKHLLFLNILRRMVVNGEKAIHKEPRVDYERPSDQRSRGADRVQSDQMSQVYNADKHHYQQTSNRTQESRTCIII